MKDHDLLEAVGGINEKFINNAVDTKKNNCHRRYGKWIAVAACVCAVLGLSLMAPSLIKLGNKEGSNVPDNSGGYASEEKQDNVSQEEVASAESGDYAPMIMVDGIVYVDLYEKYEGNIDYEHVVKVLSYVDSEPTKNGEQNFDRTSSTEYFVLDTSRIVVNIDDEWIVFGASRNEENEVPEEYVDPTN